MVDKSDIEPRNLSNSDLLFHLQKFNEEKYFTELYNRFFHLVFGFCLKHLANRTNAEEATSKCFEAIIASVKSTSISNLAGWIFGMARNICLAIHREKKKVSIAEFSNDKFILLSEPEVEYMIEKETTSIKNEIVLKEIKKLKSTQQECILLFYYEQKTYQEIQDELGLNFASVKSNLQNGKRMLRDALKKYDLNNSSFYKKNKSKND